MDKESVGPSKPVCATNQAPIGCPTYEGNSNKCWGHPIRLTSAPTTDITWWTRATAAVPVPLMGLASVVVLGALWWTVTIVRRRRRTNP